MIRAFKPSCAFNMCITKFNFMEGINPELLRFAWRNKGFFANGREIAFTILKSMRRAPIAAFRLDDFRADFKAFIFKDCSDFARPFEFRMLIIGISRKDLNAFNRTV